MTLIETLLLAVALAADAFSVAIASGGICHGPRTTFRLSFHFGLFQALMPALGALAGSAVRHLVEAAAPWIAFGLLTAIGLRMILESCKSRDAGANDEGRKDPSRGMALIGLSVATSIDAFGAGVSLAMTDANLWIACLTIGVVTGLLAIVGVRIGRAFHASIGPWAERLGGIVLIGLGVKLLLGM